MTKKMRGRISDGKVVVVSDAAGRIKRRGNGKGGERGELSFEEAAFMIERGKICVVDERGDELSYERFLRIATDSQPNFMLRYLVYRDLRERGYAVRCGASFMWLPSRGSGEKARGSGEKVAKACVRVFSERDVISLGDLKKIVEIGKNMRKQAIIAIVDDESDVTYYTIQEKIFRKNVTTDTTTDTATGITTDFPADISTATDSNAVDTTLTADTANTANSESGTADGSRVKGGEEAKAGRCVGVFLGDRVLIDSASSASEIARRLNENFYGTFISDRLYLSIVEAAYLLKKGVISVKINPVKFSSSSFGGEIKDEEVEFEQFMEIASRIFDNFRLIYAVYEDLRDKNLIPRTGLKFGAHFRVYETVGSEHSSFLVHVATPSCSFSMYDIARAVRLAHGVRKQMVFAYPAEGNEESGNRNGGRVGYISVVRVRL